MGPPVLPFLESSGEQDDSLKPRLDWVREEIAFEGLYHEFQRYAVREPLDWEQGAFLMAQLEYPKLNVQPYRDVLDQLAREFTGKWNLESITPVEAARHLASFLFKDKGFSGNREQYYEPDNSFVNRVIDRRQGIPITLSAVYVFVGNRLGLPLVGVGMPGHFLVGIEGMAPPLFVDGFNGGALLQEQDCRKFIASTGLEFHPQYLERSSTRAILTRMLRNLLNIYEEADQLNLSRRTKTLLNTLGE